MSTAYTSALNTITTDGFTITELSSVDTVGINLTSNQSTINGSDAGVDYMRAVAVKKPASRWKPYLDFFIFFEALFSTTRH